MLKRPKKKLHKLELPIRQQRTKHYSRFIQRSTKLHKQGLLRLQQRLKLLMLGMLRLQRRKKLPKHLHRPSEQPALFVRRI